MDVIHGTAVRAPLSAVSQSEEEKFELTGVIIAPL